MRRAGAWSILMTATQLDLLTERGADLSPGGRYRYELWRTWDKSKPRLLWIMLNPSVADAAIDDPTIRVCVGRAQRMGFGRIRVANLFNWRATHPDELQRADDPVGPGGDQAIWRALSGADFVICAWGDGGLATGYRRPRWREVLEIVAYDAGVKCHALELTKKGQPRHPLRIGYSVEPFLWMDRDRYLRSPK